MSRDADKYKYKKKGDIDRRNRKKERRKIWNERFEGKKTPKCEKCGKFFKSERALHMHYTKAHNKGYA